MSLVSRIAVRLQNPRLYTLVVTVISFGFLSLFGVMYTTHVDHKRAADERLNDQEWCDLIVLYDDYWSSTPPTTELAKRIAELMHRRRVTLGCP